MRGPYLEAGPQAVGVVSSVTAVTQQHVVGVPFAPADATASVEDGARPEDTSLKTGQMDEHLDTHQERVEHSVADSQSEQSFLCR